MDSRKFPTAARLGDSAVQHRSDNKILKVSRTIADLAGELQIQPTHVTAPLFLRLILRFLPLPLAFAMSSCMVMRTSENGYTPVRIVQDGTAFEGQLVAEGPGKGPSLAISAMVVGGGAVSLSGPYRLEIAAFGHEGQHQRFDIRQFRFRFANGQSFTFGAKDMRGSPLFKPGEFRNEVVAVRKAAKIFNAEPKTDRTATVEVDAVIRTSTGSQANMLRFVFEPVDSVKVEFLNIPWEIKKAIFKDRREHPITAWAPGTPTPL